MAITELNGINFIELDTVEAANKVDLNIYRFERFSETKGKYIFVKRAGK